MPYPPCSHVWIDPSEPMIQRAPYSPVIGLQRREMKRGTIYECQNCGARTNSERADVLAEAEAQQD